MKLEAVINKAIFIGPKLYGYVTDKGKTVTKIKGFRVDSIEVDELEALLYDQSIPIYINTEIFKRSSTSVK